MIKVSNCIKCKHFTGKKSCHAYPEGIPKDIYDGILFHDSIFYNQVGAYMFFPAISGKDHQLETEFNRNSQLDKMREIKESTSKIFQSEIASQGLKKEEWLSAKIILEILSRNVRRIHDLSVKRRDKVISFESIYNDQLFDNLSWLLARQKGEEQCKKIELIIYPDFSAEFNFLN